MNPVEAANPFDPEAVLSSYSEGVCAIERAAAVTVDWEAPTPCGEWRVVELVGHLLAIVRYYHRLLDAASAGRPLIELPRGGRLAAMNADDLSGLSETEGAERSRRFVHEARGYATRRRDIDWSLTLGVWSGLGPLSVGEHTGVVLGEWHVHAWDLARSAGIDHRPSDAEMIANEQQAVLRAADPGGPWIAVLRGYGHDPDWSRPPGGTA